VRPFALLLLATTSAAAVAQTDSARVRTAAFRGRVVNQIDSSLVRGADVRLYYIDSGVVVKTKSGVDSLDIFIDSTRSRFAATDSLGTFMIRRIEPGRYMLHVRRIGFAPIEAGMLIDTAVVEGTLRMEPTSQLLAKVKIIESTVDVVKQKLERVGFTTRSNMGLSADFIGRADIIKQRPMMIADALRARGVYQADVVLDRMPADFDDLKIYPADLVLGIEIYRHGRPSEFNGTRSPVDQALAKPPSGGPPPIPNRPLVVVWTFIPGSP
jgi:hypothetical protein